MMRAHDGSQVMAVIVTVPGNGDSSYHAFSRFFAPLYGVNEDPVTGEAENTLFVIIHGRSTVPTNVDYRDKATSPPIYE